MVIGSKVDLEVKICEDAKRDCLDFLKEFEEVTKYQTHDEIPTFGWSLLMEKFFKIYRVFFLFEMI